MSSRSVDHRYRTFVFKLACRRTPLSALQTDKLPRIRIVVSDPYPYLVASGQKNRMLSAKGQPPMSPEDIQSSVAAPQKEDPGSGVAVWPASQCPAGRARTLASLIC